jgi:hypothetical protein
MHKIVWNWVADVHTTGSYTFELLLGVKGYNVTPQPAPAPAPAPAAAAPAPRTTRPRRSIALAQPPTGPKTPKVKGK